MAVERHESLPRAFLVIRVDEDGNSYIWETHPTTEDEVSQTMAHDECLDGADEWNWYSQEGEVFKMAALFPDGGVYVYPDYKPY